MKINMCEKLLKIIEGLEKEQQKLKWFEKQLEDMNERQEALFEKLPMGIVIIDYHTRQILDANPHALITFDCSLDQLVGNVCTDNICPAEKCNCPILDHGLEMDQSEREIISFNGERIPVLKTVVKDEIDGNKVLIECFIDIRDKKRAEEETIKNEKLQAVLEMAGAVCHEFNQPLQVISGFCYLLKNNPEINIENKEQIDQILNAVSKMATMTRSVMNITKYETKPYLNSKIVDIKRSSCW